VTSCAQTADNPSPGQTGGTTLPGAAQTWPTPTASLTNDGEDPAQWQARADRLKAKGTNGNGAGMPLTVASAAWPTPAARDYRTPNSQESQESQESRKHTGGEQLVNFVEHHFSHPGLPTRPGQESSVHLPGSPQPSASKSSKTPRLLSRRLNPYFVEWLMGWPMGWTSTSGRHASRRAVTELWRSKLQQHLSCLLDGQESMTDAANFVERQAARAAA
jgi:hypothetical protein